MQPQAIFITALIMGFSGAMMPGPVTAVLGEHALKKGFKASPLITLGHGVMELALVLLLFFGLGRYLALEAVTGGIGLVGGVVLAWMAYGMIRGGLAGTMSLNGAASQGGEASGAAGSVMAGVLATAANPYWYLWWGTVGAAYMALAQEHGLTGALAFFGGHILADFLWLSFLAVILVTGKKFITDRMYNGLLVLFGVFLAGLALYFAGGAFLYFLPL